MTAGVGPAPVAVGIALSSSRGFMLPVSTPPNAIVHASGMIPITEDYHRNCSAVIACYPTMPIFLLSARRRAWYDLESI
jgi:hypothetical protein